MQYYRYVNSNGIIKEDFIHSIHCNDGITGKALASNILDSLKTYNVNLSKLRGQAYDGAANMSEATK